MICPLSHYWMCHALIALAIAAAVTVITRGNATAGLTAGAAFYSGREFTQWESGLAFDWPGLVAPLLAVFVVYVLRRRISPQLK